jgi:DhnA family fructose-bisphosphate aldolase class Ia
VILDRSAYADLIQARVRAPEQLQAALQNRKRRPLIGADGNLVIIALDHTARGKISIGDDPLAIADRFTLLANAVQALSVPGVDGVLASADIMEELAFLGALENVLAIGTMNRGGILGATWELDDRLTAYDVDHIAEYGLDGGKTLLRLEMTDPGVARTIEMVARISTELADRKLLNLIEPLPYVLDTSGHAHLDDSLERMVTTVAIASGLGASSAYTWLKVPPMEQMAPVAQATTLPILMLGGDVGNDASDTYRAWERAMTEPNVRGIVAGRALVYPPDGDVVKATTTAVTLVHPSLAGGRP